MKNFLKTYLGFLGLAIYYVIAFIIRIPAYFILLLSTAILLLLVSPIIGERNYKWLNNLYDWYCGD